MPEMTRQFYVHRAAEASAFADRCADREEREVYERMAANYATLAELCGPAKPNITGSAA